MNNRYFAGLLVIALLGLSYLGLHAAATTQFSYSKFSLVSSTSSVTGDTLFTPSVDGDYTIFIYTEILNTPCSGGTTVSYQLNWTDDTGANSKSGGAASCGSGNGLAPATIHVTASNAVTLDTTYFGGTHNNPYSMFLTIIGN